MWPPHLKHNSLAVIGCIQPTAALSVTAEMQCRWATRVFNGNSVDIFYTGMDFSTYSLTTCGWLLVKHVQSLKPIYLTGYLGIQSEIATIEISQIMVTYYFAARLNIGNSWSY